MSLDGCWAKVRRAENHLNEIEDEIAIFRELHPVRITVDRDLQLNAYIFKAWEIATPDPDLGLIIGDCVHNARGALDHLVYQLAEFNLRRPLTETEAKRTAFPIYDKPSEYQSRGERRVCDLRDKDRIRIELLQPYHGWDEAIWGHFLMPGPLAPISNYLSTLSELDNTDKHRTILPVWFVAGFSVPPVWQRELGITSTSLSGDPLSEGAEIGRWLFDGEPPIPPSGMDMNAFFPCQMSLWQPYFGTRVGRILGNCLIAVRMVTEMFEPVFAHGLDPAPLKYWDGGPPWL